MATRFPDGEEPEGTNIDSSHIVEWQIYIVNSTSSIELLTADNGNTLPPLTVITENLDENKDILFTCNLTLKGLNKVLFVHWGEQPFGDADSVQFNHQIPQLASIEVELESKEFIIVHPKSQQQLMEIYTELQFNPEYIGRMLNPETLMVDKILNENVENGLEANKMEYQGLNSGLLEVITKLSVNVSTIGNLSFIDSIAIKRDLLGQTEPTKPNELPSYMLRKIILHQHNFRELSPQCISLTESEKRIEKSCEDLFEMSGREEESEFIHSMDIFLLIFFQCDILYRQIFLENVAQCQCSLPLITIDPISNNLMMYDFALKKIKKTCAIDGRVEEFRIIRKPMPIISFIRLESAGRIHSKSKMINQLLGVSHNYFFHREIGGSSPKSYLLPGTIELGWYLPKKKGINEINQHITILNLRGNSLIYTKQVAFLQNVSNMIFIYVSLNRMSEQEWLFLNEMFSIHGSKFVLVIEEKFNLQENDKKKLANLKIEKNFIKLTQNVDNDKKKIWGFIKTYTQARYSIENSTGTAKDLGIILESESLKEIKSFLEIIESKFDPYIEKSSSQLTLSSVKKDIFKLQGKWWKEWSNGRRNINRVRISNEGIESSLANIKRDMKVSRINQVKYLCSLETPILQLLVGYLTNDLDNMGSSFLFLRILKIFFEDLALDLLPILYYKLKCKAEILHQACNQDLPTVFIRNEMLEIENDISESSLGEEHLMREFAQIFESTTTVDKSHRGNIQKHGILDIYSVMSLPKMAARFLLSGLPLEILDGDVSQIPITWIRSVFHEIGKIIGLNKKVYIISILGIQSSGKSTLLNTMFGLQFPVSAGRCTRGAFMQLVPIDESISQSLGYDYLMIIDTEGLKGMEKRDSSAHLHDNELATFAVGLANLTVININGEDQSEMQDILQITIFALIRMKKVELHPKCIFIHQNVVSNDADEKLITQRIRLVNILDEMTLAAANQEDLTLKYNHFSDVIGFDPESDVLYFSGLFNGEPPMAPINPGYCQDVEEARIKILMKLEKSNQFYKLHEVGRRIEEIWTCILKEDFAFHFRNVLELNVTLELEMELAKWESMYTHDLTNWECVQLNTFSNLSGEKLETFWKELTIILCEKCNSVCKAQEQELITNFFENHKSRDILKNSQNDIEEHFEVTRVKQFTNTYKNFERIYTNYQHNQDLDKLLNDIENKLLQDIKELYRMHKNQAEKGELSDKMIADLFFEKWDELSKAFPTETNKPIDIKHQLQAFFHNTEKLRSINFADKTLLIGEMDKFNEIGSIQEFPIIKGYHYIKVRDFVKIMGISKRNFKINDIRCFLYKLQEECQSLINNKFTNESNFSENVFMWILDLVDKQFTIRNKENVNNNIRERNYKLTKNLVHDFAFFQCCKLIPHFEVMQMAFLERNSIKYKVENKKEQFKIYFFSLWKGVQNDQCAANELATPFFNSISDSAHKLMERAITTVFMERTNQSLTKYGIQLNILIELCEKECFDSYLQYIHDPFEYIRTKLQHQMHFFYTKDEMRDIVLEGYNQNISNLIDITVTAAQKALGQINMEDSTNEQDASTIQKHTWKNTFLELVKDDIPNISIKKLAIFDAYDIKDYNAFIQTFSDLLSEKQKENNVQMPEEYRVFCDELLQHKIQCKECCPYCNELCQRNLPSHEHYCGVFHKPLGLKGIKNNSNVLISEPCPGLVKKKGIFKFRSARVANLDFNESWLRQSNWRVNEREALDTHYWIWVMRRFQLQFEEYFHASPNIREQSLLTKDEILTELRDKLATIGSTHSSPEVDTNAFRFPQIIQKLVFFLFH